VATPPAWKHEIETLDLGRVRAAIHAGRKLRLHYADEQGRRRWASSCRAWSAIGTKRLLVGWCETRDDFRTFRTDRVVEVDFLDDRYPGRPAVLRARWFALMAARRAEWEAQCAEAGGPPTKGPAAPRPEGGRG